MTMAGCDGSNGTRDKAGSDNSNLHLNALR
jgi:hypothetical protein